jgi:hypothetical protein
MRNSIVKGLCAGALWLLADAAPVWPQNNAALIGPLIGAGTSAVNSFSSLAAQQRALKLQREQTQQMQQTRQLQQDQAVIRRHPSPALPGSSEQSSCMRTERESSFANNVELSTNRAQATVWMYGCIEVAPYSRVASVHGGNLHHSKHGHWPALHRL